MVGSLDGGGERNFGAIDGGGKGDFGAINGFGGVFGPGTSVLFFGFRCPIGMQGGVFGPGTPVFVFGFGRVLGAPIVSVVSIVSRMSFRGPTGAAFE